MILRVTRQTDIFVSQLFIRQTVTLLKALSSNQTVIASKLHHDLAELHSERMFQGN